MQKLWGCAPWIVYFIYFFVPPWLVYFTERAACRQCCVMRGCEGGDITIGVVGKELQWVTCVVFFKNMVLANKSDRNGHEHVVFKVAQVASVEARLATLHHTQSHDRTPPCCFVCLFVGFVHGGLFNVAERRPL